jgi:hypothetical protein
MRNENKSVCLLLFEGTFTSFFKDKEVIKMSQNSKNQIVLLFLLDEGRIRIRTNNGGSGSGELQKHPDPDWNK